METGQLYAWFFMAFVMPFIFRGSTLIRMVGAMILWQISVINIIHDYC